MNRTLALSFLCAGVVAGSSTIIQPTFSARRDYPSAGGRVLIGDVNGDGIPDIVAVGFSCCISTMLGNGNGTFRPPKTFTVPGPFTVLSSGVLIDLNGDGNADLIISGGDSAPGFDGIGVLMSNGDGTFQNLVFYVAGRDNSAGNPIVADFNGDGIPDVIIPGSSGIWLFTGKGGGAFNPGVLTTPFSGAFWMAAADFNGDGIPDLVVSYNPSGLGVLLGKGGGYFQPPVSIGNNPWAYVVAGDVNGDGYPDVVVPGATIYLNNRRGGFQAPYTVSVPGEGVALGDVNGDGITDLAGSQGYVALGLGRGKFAPGVANTVANTNGWYSVALAEMINGRKPGYDDIIVGLNGTVSVLVNRGNDTFPDGEWIPISGGNNCGASADFNGDGKPDLAVLTGQGLQILLGTGKATSPYTLGVTLPFSGGGCPIAGDVNGDGIPDLLEGANSLGGVGVYLGKGDGTFTLASVVAMGPANNLVLGDFNHDGKVDFATSSNELALGNRDGTFQSPIAIIPNPPPLGFTWIAAGDVNNDGWTDLLATQSQYCCGALYVMLNNQHGGFNLTTITDADAPISVMLADLNGDGNLDAVVTEDGNATAHIYLGNGLGEFKSGQTNIPYPFVDELPAQIGDVNGDGILDLLLAGDGGVAVALGTGKGTFAPPFVEGVGPGVGQVFAQALHGQPSGLADIVAPDYTGGITILINTTK
jgi:hypothetical protein